MSPSACPSLRFVTADGSPLPANLAALWGADPRLAAEVEASPDPTHVRVDRARNGSPTAAVGSVQLHSRYDPEAEADKLVTSAGVDDQPAVFVLGLGLGYAVEAVLRRTPTTTRVWAFEPDVGLFRAALEHRPGLADPIAAGRLTVLTRLDRAALLRRFTPLSTLLVAGVAIVEHAPSVARHADFFDGVRTWIEEVRSYAKTTVNTAVLNGTRTIRNLTANLPWYLAAPGIGRLKDAYKGKPAILVSAGPSLRKNQHLLPEAAGKAVVVAVQTTLKPLLEIGVEPDFVTALDYAEVSAQFYEGLPPTCRTELVAEPKATDAIFGRHPGPLTLVGSEYLDDLLRERKPDRPRLRSGATVAHLAFYLAEHLGCSPIILVGQDLAFGDGLFYAPGTRYDDVWRPELGRFSTVETKQWERIARERHILRRTRDADGNALYTEERLFHYLTQFERDFAASSATILDATEGGAVKRGTTRTTLRDALDAHCTDPIPTRPKHPGINVESLASARSSLVARRAEATEMLRVANATLPELEALRDGLDDAPRANAIIAKLDGLRREMNAIGRTYDLAMLLAQGSELTRFRADLRIDGGPADGVARQRKQLGRDLDHCRAVAAAAAEFVALMDDALARLDAWSERRAAA